MLRTYRISLYLEFMDHILAGWYLTAGDDAGAMELWDCQDNLVAVAQGLGDRIDMLDSFRNALDGKLAEERTLR